MIGVSSGIVSTLGYLSPDPQVLMQMGAAMGTGMGIGAFVANKINVIIFFCSDIATGNLLKIFRTPKNPRVPIFPAVKKIFEIIRGFLFVPSSRNFS